MLVLLGGLEDLLEHGAAKGVEPADGEIQNAALRDVRGFFVHHLADVADLQVDPVLGGELLDGFEIRPLIHTHLSGHDGAHRFSV